MANWLVDGFNRLTGMPPKAAAGSVQIGIVSPWADSSTLAKIAYSDLFNGATDLVDRTSAMSVAAVRRARNIIVGSIQDLPLVSGRFTKDGFATIDRQPSWLTNTKTNVSPLQRMANTVDDLLFYGRSLWAVQRTEADTIVDAIHVHRSRWSYKEDSAVGIQVDGQDVEDVRSIIFFTGPDDGFLIHGADVIRGARAIEQAWIGRVQNPVPTTVLHEVEPSGQGSRITAAQAQAYVDDWSAARSDPNGTVGFLPATLQMETYGDTVTDLFTEGRNNIRLDVANHFNIAASLLDGSTATASLTYATSDGNFSQLAAWIELWIAPIEARLSMDDVCAHGQIIRFDRSDLIQNHTFGAPQIEQPDAAAPVVTPTPEEASA